MLQVIQQAQATPALRRSYFWLLDVATGTIGQTGKTPTIRVAKNDDTNAAAAGATTEFDATELPGLYYYQATQAEVDTLGTLVLYITCSGCLTRRIHLTITEIGPTTGSPAAGTVMGALADIEGTGFVKDTDSLVDLAHTGADADTLETLSGQIDTLPTTAEIDTELSGVHGSGSWEDKEGAGSGANVATLTVRDSVTLNGIPDVIVQVFNVGLTTLLRWGITDSNGQIVFNLDDGTYKIMLRKHGSYSFSNPEDLIVSGTTEDTYDGIAFSPSTPPSPETCVIFGTTHDIGDLPVSVDVEADLVEPKKFTSGGIQIIKGAKTVSSAALDGYWELVLTRSSEYTAATVRYSFKINGIALCEYVIPDQDNVNFADLSENQP